MWPLTAIARERFPLRGKALPLVFGRFAGIRCVLKNATATNLTHTYREEVAAKWRGVGAKGGWVEGELVEF